MKTLVMGLGNDILSDDAIGILAARRLAGKIGGGALHPRHRGSQHRRNQNHYCANHGQISNSGSYHHSSLHWVQGGLKRK